MAKHEQPAGPTPDAEGEGAPAETATIEDWREVRASAAWAFEAAKCLRNWSIGQVVSLSEYDSAIKAAHTIEVS